jgi:phosphate:Na+ symporter
MISIAIDVLRIVGALGLFIFGMKVMSENIQRVAGAPMRRFIGAITRSNFRAVITGVLTTSLLQSSSATTVMAVSFVNARILQLREAVGVVFGANIGTTITAWVIAFAVGRVDIRELALPMIAVALPLLFMKRSKLRYTGETLVGFALMFIGLQLLQNAVPNLRTSPEFLNYLAELAEGRFASPLLFVVLGTLVAGLVQSSTAAIALTVALMANGVLSVEMAAAMVLGENIGTTVTANLAAIVANREAQRTARVHSLINLIGVAWMLIVLPYAISTINQWLDASFDLADETHDAVVIAVFHTSFNIANVLLLIGFSDHLIRISQYFVKKGTEKPSQGISYIGGAVMATPELAVLEVQREMKRFAKEVTGMNTHLRRLLDASNDDDRAVLVAMLRQSEEQTDRFKRSISAYLIELAKLEVAQDTSLKLRGLMSAADHLERIADLYYQIALNLEIKNKQRVYFIPRQRQNLKEMTLLIDGAFEIMEANLQSEETTINPAKAKTKEIEINTLRDTLRERHLQDVAKDKYSQSSGVFYSDTFSALEEIADHIFGVSEGMTR